jgi:hypothetical protein
MDYVEEFEVYADTLLEDIASEPIQTVMEYISEHGLGCLLEQ